MKRIFDLIEKGVFTTRLVTMILTGTLVYMWVSQIAIDEKLGAAWLIIMGFWFQSEITKNGSKK